MRYATEMIPQPQSVTSGSGVVEVKDSQVVSRIDSSLPSEGYTLEVAEDGKVTVVGGSEAGVFYGTQTFRQLLPAASLRSSAAAGPYRVPVLKISDSPLYHWRGVMLDVARHFMPVSDLLKFIDLAAFHKLNVLHLHITDDQGWRFEVPKWPKLTTVACWRKRSMLGANQHEAFDARPHGGFYSVDELKQVVAFAAQRHIKIVPEVDMPGHMQAAISAYPELGNAKEKIKVREEWGISTNVFNMSDVVLQFCRDVLDTVCEIFPSDIIGIGGDECPHDEWKASESVQALIKKLGLKSESELHGWFVVQMSEHLQQQKQPRRTYGWDEILCASDSLPKETLMAAWRGVEPTVIAAKRGFDVVACPDILCYLDYRQSELPDEPTPMGTLLTVKDVYNFDPIPSELTDSEKTKVIGGQVNVWTEHMESARRVEYMVYPRLCAFSEVVWGKTSAEGNYESFDARLKEHYARLDALNVNYRPPSGPRPWDARPDALGNPRTMEERLAHNEELLQDIR